MEAPPPPDRLPDGLPLPEDSGDEACSAIPSLGPPPPLPRRAVALGLFALAVRAAAAYLDPVPPRDAVAMAETLRLAALGDGLSLTVFTTATHHPLATWLALPLHMAGLDPVTSLTLVAILAASLAAVVFHRVTFLLLGDEDAATAAALLYAVSPPFVRLGSTALAEPLLHLCVLLSLHATLRALRHWRPTRPALLAGLFAGAGFLARPEALALVPLSVAACLPRGGGRPLRHRVAATALALAGFLVLAVPWAAHLSLERSKLTVFHGKDPSVLVGAQPAPQAGGAAPAERHSLAAATLQAAGALPEAMHPLVLALAMLGMVVTLRQAHCRREGGRLAILGLASASFLAGVVMLEWRYGYGGRRHASTAGLLLVPFAGSGLMAAVAGYAAFRARRRRKRAGDIDVVSPPGETVHTITVVAGFIALALLVGSLLQRDVSGAEAAAMGRRLAKAGAPAPYAPWVGTFGEPRIALYSGGTDYRLLRRFGITADMDRAQVEQRAADFRAFLRAADVRFIVLRDGDRRVPPGFPAPGTPPPLFVEGRLRAWLTKDLLLGD